MFPAAISELKLLISFLILFYLFCPQSSPFEQSEWLLSFCHTWAQSPPIALYLFQEKSQSPKNYIQGHTIHPVTSHHPSDFLSYYFPFLTSFKSHLLLFLFFPRRLHVPLRPLHPVFSLPECSSPVIYLDNCPTLFRPLLKRHLLQHI